MMTTIATNTSGTASAQTEDASKNLPRRRNCPTRRLTSHLHLGQSSWISAVTYVPRHDSPGKGFLVIFTKDAKGVITYADVPCWLKGLVLAGINNAGRRSVGRAYHLLVRGKYPSQTFTSPADVDELKKMFGVGVNVSDTTGA